VEETSLDEDVEDTRDDGHQHDEVDDIVPGHLVVFTEEAFVQKQEEAFNHRINPR
jgi:hypothetical protein